MFRFILLSILSLLVVSEESFDFECGGTSLFEQHIESNQTVTVGEVPAGLHRLAIHVWSDVDMDIQLVSGNTTVIHWMNGVIYHGETKESSFEGDTFVYSGYNGDGFGAGNEYIIFDGLTSNDYKFLIYANQGGHVTARYGWIPLETCDITAKHYRKLHELKANGAPRRRLWQELHDSIDEHTRISYTAVWTALQSTDQNPSKSDQIIGIYTRRGISKTWRDGSSTCGGNRENCWNREHVWAQSRGDLGTKMGPGTDLHALRAEDRSVNTQRSNKNFMAGGSVVPDCSICKQTSTTFEPPAAAKGAVARMLFYMSIRYNGDADSNGVDLYISEGDVADEPGSVGYIGDLTTLKAWNDAYPPSADEINRNNIIQSYYQGNRNPFIDNPSLANDFF